ATKVFNTAEGGAILTNNNELALKMRNMRDFGFSGYDKVIHLGLNGKMSEVCAALGLTNLESFQEFVEINKRNYYAYLDYLADISGLAIQEYDCEENNNWQYIVMEIDQAITGVTRNELVKVLHDNRILARRYFWPGCHMMEPYRTLYPDAASRLSETDNIALKVIVLPTGCGVNTNDIKTICALIKENVQH
ncbi:DegT/DnrJ/EryC1/StrS family aminotransferase, partial [bacterium]|nr:DegT/DnrJ/EryC1/StrS family aminotransferase [bacterium]